MPTWNLLRNADQALQPLRFAMDVYEVRQREDHRGVDLVSDALPFIIALIVGGVFVFAVLSVAVTVNLFPRKPK